MYENFIAFVASGFWTAFFPTNISLTMLDNLLQSW